MTGPLPPVPIADQIACVTREIAQRRRVYARLISTGRMTPVKAQTEQRHMEAVLETLEGIAAKGRLL